MNKIKNIIIFTFFIFLKTFLIFLKTILIFLKTFLKINLIKSLNKLII